jgi:transposase
MFITEVLSKGKRGKTYTSILLRESFRVGAKVKSKTLAVLTHLPAHVLEAIRRAIAQPALDSLTHLATNSAGAFCLRAAESFGALWVVDQLAKQLGIKQAVGLTRQAQLSYWQVLGRVLRPGTSLLAMVRLATQCAAAAMLGWRQAFSEDDLYANGAWLEGRHGIIERRLWQSRPDKSADQLFLYDVSSSYFEGEHNALADWGYNRDGKKNKKQVVVGLLTDVHGEPISTQVYQGNTRDLKTFGAQVKKIKKDFGCEGVTMVGDRGMIRKEQRQEANAAGFHFITALSKPEIEKLLKDKVFQLELFEDKICELIGQADQRYILRRNPIRQQEIAQNRNQRKSSLEQSIEKANTYLKEHRRAKVKTQRRILSAKLQRLGLNKWLSLQVKNKRLQLTTDKDALAQESRLDGCYVVRTDLKPAQADAQTVHDRYKDLAKVERDFRTLKSGHLDFRPWFVCKQENTQAHALTSMLALKVRRALEKAWWPLETTVEEGLKELEKLCVMQLIHPETQAVISRHVPMANSCQKKLLDALGLTLPTTIAQAKVTVGTRKKINETRKPLAK